MWTKFMNNSPTDKLLHCAGEWWTWRRLWGEAPSEEFFIKLLSIQPIKKYSSGYHLRIILNHSNCTIVKMSIYPSQNSCFLRRFSFSVKNMCPNVSVCLRGGGETFLQNCGWNCIHRVFSKTWHSSKPQPSFRAIEKYLSLPSLHLKLKCLFAQPCKSTRWSSIRRDISPRRCKMLAVQVL